MPADHRMTAAEVIALLGLVPLRGEGGWYRETWRSEETVPAEALPARYGGGRSFGTAIYFLITAEEPSRVHRLASDEVFHFYLGDPAELSMRFPDGTSGTAILGPDLAAGQRPQVTVPRGVWQQARVAPGGEWALLGTTVAPGFDFADYAQGEGTG